LPWSSASTAREFGSPCDAVRCVERGVRAIIVSDHGGRHLDTTVTTAAAIGEVACPVLARPKFMSMVASGAARTFSKRWRSAPAP
jgi:isopentenyl diphosphate isomerase/L-lactate dehydrogenase-like FMN-dependent dehydrogenase